MSTKKTDADLSNEYEAERLRMRREVEEMREDFVDEFKDAYDDGGHDGLLHEMEAAIRRARQPFEGYVFPWNMAALVQAVSSLKGWHALSSEEWAGLLDEIADDALAVFYIEEQSSGYCDMTQDYEDFTDACGRAYREVRRDTHEALIVSLDEDTVGRLASKVETFAVPGQAGNLTQEIYDAMLTDLARKDIDWGDGEVERRRPRFARDAWDGLLEGCERRALDLFRGQLREDYLDACGRAEGHARLLLAVEDAARGFEEAAEGGDPGVGLWARRAYDCDVEGMQAVISPHRPRLVLDAREGEIAGTSPRPGRDEDDSVTAGLSEEAAAAARKWMDDRRAPSIGGTPAPDRAERFELWAAPCDGHGRPEGREVQEGFEPSVELDARLNLDAHGTYRGREWFVFEAEDCDDIMGADEPHRREGVGADYIPHIIDAAPRRGDLLAVERVERDELGRGPRPADREEAREAARAGFEEACDAPCDLTREEWAVYAACSTIYANESEGWGMRCELSATDLAHSAHMWGEGAEERALETLESLIRWGLVSATIMEDGAVTMWAAPTAGPTSWRAKDGDELDEVERYALAKLAGEGGAATDRDRTEAALAVQSLDLHRLPPTGPQIARIAKTMEWLRMPELREGDEEEGNS